MALLEQQGQLQRAVEVGHRALTRYPDTPLRLKLAHGLADLSAQLGDFRQAAEASEAFVASYDRARAGKDGPRIEPALLEEASGWVAPAQGEAGLYWAALGKTDRAVAAYQAYLRRFPERKDASEVALALGRLQEDAGRLTAAAQAYEKAEDALSRSRRPRARFEALGLQLQARRKAKQASRVKAVQQRVRTALGRAGVPRPGRIPRPCSTYAELGCSDDAEALFDQYRRIDFAPCRRRCSRPRPGNGSLLKVLEQAYVGAIDRLDLLERHRRRHRIGQAWTLTSRPSIAWRPTPKELAEEDRAQYRDELEEVAAPLEQGRWTRCRRAWRRPTARHLHRLGRSGAGRRETRRKPGT